MPRNLHRYLVLIMLASLSFFAGIRLNDIERALDRTEADVAALEEALELQLDIFRALYESLCEEYDLPC